MMINLTINGKNVQAEDGMTIMQAAEANGFDIPKLCALEHLEPYGGCRLCLVDVEGARNLLPSCTAPATEGMVIETHTDQIEKARKFVLDLIFSERNHFCMFCQKTDGDCELQNSAYELGMTHWEIQPKWDNYQVDASNKWMVFDNNRCILCRRCVRACDELIGNKTLGSEERGYETQIVFDWGVPWGESSCINCGTCLQVCPTGAIMDRHSAYLGKETECESIKTTCVQCGVGCGIEVLVKGNQVVKIKGDWDADNHGVLCEKGRFEALNLDRNRVKSPMIRKGGNLVPASWEEAISVVAEKLQGAKGDLNAISSNKLTAEALLAFKSVFEGLGAKSITSKDHDYTIFDEAFKEYLGSYPKPLTDKAENLGNGNTYVAEKLGIGTCSDREDGKVAYLALGDETICIELAKKYAALDFVVVQAAFESAAMDCADVVLPVATWMEEAGSYVSLTGKMSETKKCVDAPANIYSNYDVLAKLAGALKVELTADVQAALN
jgi:formate dehydrogenase major subunit